MRICDLRQKEVINICNCRRLGFVGDVDVDPMSGQVMAIIVPECGHMFGLFGKEKEYVIPVRCIRQVGDEIILVEIIEEEVMVKVHL